MKATNKFIVILWIFAAVVFCAHKCKAQATTGNLLTVEDLTPTASGGLQIYPVSLQGFNFQNAVVDSAGILVPLNKNIWGIITGGTAYNYDNYYMQCRMGWINTPSFYDFKYYIKSPNQQLLIYQTPGTTYGHVYLYFCK